MDYWRLKITCLFGVRRLFVVVLGFCLLNAGAVLAQSFSCGIGKPACLSWGETVCSSSGKCVSDTAMCFDQWQCNYEGFTCKSNVSDCLDEYESLRSDYNRLVEDFNDLLRSKADLASEHDDLLKTLKTFVDKATEIEFCVTWAQTIEEAKSCF